MVGFNATAQGENSQIEAAHKETRALLNSTAGLNSVSTTYLSLIDEALGSQSEQGSVLNVAVGLNHQRKPALKVTDQQFHADD